MANTGRRFVSIPYERTICIRDGLYKTIYDTNVSTYTHVLPRNSDSLHWYQLAMTYTSPFILRSYCNTEDQNSSEVCLVTEEFECTLQEWTDQNDILVQDRGSTDWLNPRLTRILLDIMDGTAYCHETMGCRHGEICAENIVIKDGRAKLTNFLCPSFTRRTKVGDVRDFGTMVNRLFGANAPPELTHFLDLVARCTQPPRFLELSNHPVLLSRKQRVYFRLIARAEAKSWGINLDAALAATLPQRHWVDWRAAVSGAYLISVRAYGGRTYSRGPEAFARFSRNACEHLSDHDVMTTEEELDENLNRLWPDFLGAYFSALYGSGVTLPRISQLWGA